MLINSTHPVSRDLELHPRVQRPGLEAHSVGMRVGPEVVLGGVEGVRLEGEALAVADTHGLQKQRTLLEQVAAPAHRPHAVMEASDDARIHVGSCKTQIHSVIFRVNNGPALAEVWHPQIGRFYKSE